MTFGRGLVAGQVTSERKRAAVGGGLRARGMPGSRIYCMNAGVLTMTL